jgi:hypothetical protein
MMNPRPPEARKAHSRGAALVSKGVPVLVLHGGPAIHQHAWIVRQDPVFGLACRAEFENELDGEPRSPN